MGWDSWAYVFVFFLLVTPGAQFGVSWARKRRARRALQLERDARVVPIILELQTVATCGLPLARFEQLPLACEVERAVRATPQSRPIDLVVDLPAGVPFDAAPVAAALAAHEAPVTLIVPRRALVGGIALARVADAILLGPGAVLCDDTAASVSGAAGRRDNEAVPVGHTDDEHVAARPTAAVDLTADEYVAAKPTAAVAAGADRGPVAATDRISAVPANVCDLAGLLALGLPATEGLPTTLPAYLARFREPQPTWHKWPLYMALASSERRA